MESPGIGNYASVSHYSAKSRPMPDVADELPALRCIHLQGGCRAHHYSGNVVQLEPTTLSGVKATIGASSYGAVYSDLRQAGLTAIGVDFYTNPEHTDGRWPPNWAGYIRTATASWLCVKQSDLWAQIAYGAICKKQGRLWDVASRLSHQLRVCDWRLRQLSEAYYQQLNAIVRSNRFKCGLRMADGFTWLGYLAVQSFVIDACVLRDYLAEFRGLTLATTIGSRPKITSLATLRILHLEKSDALTEADRSIQEAVCPGGWLHMLGGYRNLVVHWAPIASAGKDLFAFGQSLPLSQGELLPFIKLPIPHDPTEIIASRRSGSRYEDPDQNYARFLNALSEPRTAPDALEYAHAVLGKLAILAMEMAEMSPVAPKMRHLTIEDGFAVET